MIVSLNEAAGMATKAASGAGRPWGLAQEAGYAVSALEAMCLPGAASLLNLLIATDGTSCERMRPISTNGGIWRGEGPLCPVLTGAYIADGGAGESTIRLESVYAPLLLLPFARLAFAGVQLEWNDTRIRANRIEASVECKAVSASVAATVQITTGQPLDIGAAGITFSSQSGPVDIGDEIWEGLSALAHRTYVPASEASRLKGAGAGLTDND